MIICDNITVVDVTNTTTYNISDLHDSANTTSGDEAGGDNYDSYGAMQFIITTVTVYAAMGVFCTLISNIRRKTSKQILAMQDDCVLKYLKQEKSLKLQGFHMQLKSLRDQYTVMVRQYEEKMRLLEIRKELEDMDSGSPVFKRARNTRRLSLFTLHQGIKDKFHGNKKRPSMDNTIGRAGLSLIHFAGSQPGLGIQEENEEGSSTKASQSDISSQKSTMKTSSVGGSAEFVVRSEEDAAEESVVSDSESADTPHRDTCVVEIEDYKPGAKTGTSETDSLLPPASSHLSESV